MPGGDFDHVFAVGERITAAAAQPLYDGYNERDQGLPRVYVSGPGNQAPGPASYPSVAWLHVHAVCARWQRDLDAMLDYYLDHAQPVVVVSGALAYRTVAESADPAAPPFAAAWTRRWRRAIWSLANAGSAGQVATFVSMRGGPWGGDPAGADFDTLVTTPDDQREHSGKLFRHDGSQWVAVDRAAEPTLEPDELSGNGRARAGDLLGPHVFNESRDAMRLFRCVPAAQASDSTPPAARVTAWDVRGYQRFSGVYSARIPFSGPTVLTWRAEAQAVCEANWGREVNLPFDPRLGGKVWMTQIAYDAQGPAAGYYPETNVAEGFTLPLPPGGYSNGAAPDAYPHTTLMSNLWSTLTAYGVNRTDRARALQVFAMASNPGLNPLGLSPDFSSFGTPYALGVAVDAGQTLTPAGDTLRHGGIGKFDGPPNEWMAYPFPTNPLGDPITGKGFRLGDLLPVVRHDVPGGFEYGWA